MQGKLRPPIAQKPIDDTGYFSTIWGRFFLSLGISADESKDNGPQAPSSADSVSGLETSIADLTLKHLLLVSESTSYQKKIDELEQHIMLLESNYQSQIEEVKTAITDINTQLTFFGIYGG